MLPFFYSDVLECCFVSLCREIATNGAVTCVDLERLRDNHRDMATAESWYQRAVFTQVAKLFDRASKAPQMPNFIHGPVPEATLPN